MKIPKPKINGEKLFILSTTLPLVCLFGVGALCFFWASTTAAAAGAGMGAAFGKGLLWGFLGGAGSAAASSLGINALGNWACTNNEKPETIVHSYPANSNASGLAQQKLGPSFAATNTAESAAQAKPPAASVKADSPQF